MPESNINPFPVLTPTDGISNYSPSTACPKCGNTSASTTWCPGRDLAGHVAGCVTVGEHIHRNCPRCSYVWLEKALNA